ncbi:MAG TPA: Clp protease N-terminal domain-containing protein, partial [Gemmatimonadales bacterium]|nr:Clp protease N-terminal domain-containing protein [Gemmatimonadales bacterium]
MIRPERLTIKAQEAFRDAGADAARRGNPVTNDAHLFAALLNQSEGVVRPLLQKSGLNITALLEEIEREIAKFPTQAGATAEPTLSRELTRVFDRAEN